MSDEKFYLPLGTGFYKAKAPRLQGDMDVSALAVAPKGLVEKAFANDKKAAAGGVEVGGLYHTAGSIKVRLK